MMRLSRTPILTLAAAAVILIGAACGGSGSDTTIEFPDDLPVFDGAIKEGEEERDGTLYVTYTTNAPRDEVTRFYRQNVDADPWFVTNYRDQVQGGGATIAFRRLDDTIVGTVDISSDGDDGSRFVIAVSPNAGTPVESGEATESAGDASASPSAEPSQ
jgi:hypothetical protein